MHAYSVFYTNNNLTANYEIPSWRVANTRQKLQCTNPNIQYE